MRVLNNTFYPFKGRILMENKTRAQATVNMLL